MCTHLFTLFFFVVFCLFLYYREHLFRDAKKLFDRQAKHAAHTHNHNHTHNQDITVAAYQDSRNDTDRSLEKRICTAITAGYFMNSAVLCAHGNVFKYLSLLDLERQRHKQDAIDVRMVHIHPTSSLSVDGAECPHNYLLYQALVHSSKLFMKQIAKADSKLLKTLQREWQYVDPYVLCGRQQERAAQFSGSAATTTATVTNTASTVKSISAAVQANSEVSKAEKAVLPTTTEGSDPKAASERSVLGNKRPLSPPRETKNTVTAVAGASGSGSAGNGGANAAAEAAKQRYLDRMAQQKARK